MKRFVLTLVAMAGAPAEAQPATEVARVVLADALPEADGPRSALTLAFEWYGERPGTTVWGGGYDRQDHRGRIIESAATRHGIRLAVRMLVRQRDSAKPWAPVRPGLVGEYKAELQGQWQSLP